MWKISCFMFLLFCFNFVLSLTNQTAMIDSEENKLSRNMRIQLLMNEHLATLSPNAPALTGYVGNLNTTMDEIMALAQVAFANLKGYVEQKADRRGLMEKQALKVSGSMKAYFVSTDDELNADRAHLTKGKLHNSREAGTVFLCENVLKMAQEHIAAIVPFGVSAAMLTDLETYIDDYRQTLSDTKRDRKEKVIARRKFSERLKDCDKVLVIISGIMEALKDDHEMLYLRFKYGMRIGKSGGGKRKKPDFEETLSAGEVAVIADLPYEPKRSIRVRNKSKVALKWGLSESDSEFTNPAHDLKASATSQKLSSTLASSGNYLVFENLSDKPAVVQVWVGEG